MGAKVAATLERGGVDLEGPRGSKPERRLGSSVLELTASYQAFVEYPSADEGELSARRAEVHRTSRVAGFARRHQLADDSEDAVVSNIVEVELARRLLSCGGDAALGLARDVLA